MKVTVQRGRDEIETLRRAAYLKAWPVHRQMEAMQDRDGGRPEKWNRMQADFARIRQELPFPP